MRGSNDSGFNLVPIVGEVLSEKSYVYDEMKPVRRRQPGEEYLRQKGQFMRNL